MKSLLLKIRNLPEHQRKIIFWIVMVVLALTLSTFFISDLQKRMPNISAEKTKEELQLPYLEENLKKLPNIKFPEIEIPEINQETLQGLEKMMEEMPTETTSCHDCQPSE